MKRFELCQVLVQPSNRRAYPMASYSNAGARIQGSVLKKQRNLIINWSQTSKIYFSRGLLVLVLNPLAR